MVDLLRFVTQEVMEKGRNHLHVRALALCCQSLSLVLDTDLEQAYLSARRHPQGQDLTGDDVVALALRFLPVRGLTRCPFTHATTGWWA